MTHITFEQAVAKAKSQLDAAPLFYGHGMSNSQDEAVYAAMFCAALPVFLPPDWDAAYPSEAQQQLEELIAQRCLSQKPLAYLTREAFLHEYAFYIDERALVPRSFIGELILEDFEPWIEDASAVTDILELCTGSGCLAIMAADVFGQAHVDASDIDHDALDVARINVDRYGLEDAVTLYQGDLFEAIPKAKKYDIIFSNPPYVNSDSMSKLPAEYRQEPNLALAGGTDGMDLVRTIVAEAKSFLKPDGILIVEIGNEYENACQAFSELPLVWLETSGSDQSVFLIQAQDLP